MKISGETPSSPGLPEKFPLDPQLTPLKSYFAFLLFLLPSPFPSFCAVVSHALIFSQLREKARISSSSSSFRSLNSLVTICASVVVVVVFVAAAVLLAWKISHGDFFFDRGKKKETRVCARRRRRRRMRPSQP